MEPLNKLTFFCLVFMLKVNCFEIFGVAYGVVDEVQSEALWVGAASK